MDFTNKLVLAPMAGVCDQPFRLLAKEQGCDILYTEMISAKGLYYNNKNTVPLLMMEPEEKPIGVLAETGILFYRATIQAGATPGEAMILTQAFIRASMQGDDTSASESEEEI